MPQGGQNHAKMATISRNDASLAPAPKLPPNASIAVEQKLEQLAVSWGPTDLRMVHADVLIIICDEAKATMAHAHKILRIHGPPIDKNGRHKPTHLRAY